MNCWFSCELPNSASASTIFPFLLYMSSHRKKKIESHTNFLVIEHYFSFVYMSQVQVAFCCSSWKVPCLFSLLQVQESQQIGHRCGGNSMKPTAISSLPYLWTFLRCTFFPSSKTSENKAVPLSKLHW